MNKPVCVIFIFYLIALLSLQYINTSSDRSKYLIRKSVHLSTGLILFFLTFNIDKISMLIIISVGTLFAIITYNLKRFNFIHTTSGSSLGTLFYPFGILFSFLILFNMPVYYFQIVLMILSLSDTLANVCGAIKKFNFRFTVFYDLKSIIGVAGFALSAFIIHFALLPEPLNGINLYILVSVIAAVHFEVISIRGSDNFSIPVGCSLFFLLTNGEILNPILPLTLIPLIAFGAVLVFKKNILTRYGAITTYLLGIYFFTILGIKWSIPVLIFFITSVIFTKINGIANHKSGETNRRNIWQVLANIFFALLSSAVYLATENEIFIYFYITLIATVTADTWASEIGPIFSKKCFSLYDFRIQKSGVSGGISFPGTLAALSGSLIISILSYYLFFGTIDITLISIIAIASFAAVFTDSVFSAFIEPELMKINYFKNAHSPDSPAPNDIINLSASVTAPLFFIIIKLLV